MPIIFVMQGKCLFSDISRPVLNLSTSQACANPALCTCSLMLILPVSLPLKRVSGSMSSRPPKFLLIACNISNHVGGCLDFSAKENTIFTRLKERNVDCVLRLLLILDYFYHESKHYESLIRLLLIVVSFLHLLHKIISKCNSDYFYHESKHNEPY